MPTLPPDAGWPTPPRLNAESDSTREPEPEPVTLEPAGDPPPEQSEREILAPDVFPSREHEEGMWRSFWSQPRSQLVMQIGAVSAGAVLLVGILAWNLLFAGMPNLPPTERLWSLNREPAVQFVDAKGNVLAARGPLYGRVVRAEELPAHVSQAFIAAEDQRFYEHDGVDMQSITRAMVANVSAGQTEQGGSTITQQLVKNVLLDDRRTFRRKAQEARLASQLENRLSKEEILDLYLNRIYLGSNAYGIEAAAQTYFGVPAAELSLSQASFLAALPKAPSRFAEDKTGAQVKERQGYVLDRMVESGFVTKEQADLARAQKLAFVDPEKRPGLSGYVMDAATEEAKKVLPDLPPDAVITLTVDADLQRRAEQALKATLKSRSLGANEGAVVVMDRSGGVRAMVGGKDYATSQFNRVTQAKRQPGSLFKTFVYAAALERGLHPDDVRDDAPIRLANWEPRNYDDSYRGPITLARALAISSNSVAVQVGSEVGPRRVVEIAKRFGVESPLQANPSLALGTDEVTLMEIVGAFGVLSNNGRQTRPHLVSEIRNLRGEVLYVAPEEAGTPVYPRELTETMTGMLGNVVRYGTGAAAQVPGWEIAGKTGTSQSWRDAWFVGYSSRLVGGVWIGNDDDRATKKVTGGGAAAALFSRVMTSAHRGVKPAPLPGYEEGAQWLGSSFDDGWTLDEEWMFEDMQPLDEEDRRELDDDISNLDRQLDDLRNEQVEDADSDDERPAPERAVLTNQQPLEIAPRPSE